jgi:membrane associated rhomboid family serine protease
MAGLVALLWALEVIDYLTLNALDNLALEPRTTEGIFAILIAPYLHFGFDHLLSNTLPLFLLGFVIALSGLRRLFGVSLLVTVVGGIGVWLLSPENSRTAGASILIFGYLGYLLVRGFFERSVKDILIAVVVFAVYGPMLWGVLPTQPGVSWQGHLFGLIGGILAARVFRSRPAVGAPPGRSHPFGI